MGLQTIITETAQAYLAIPAGSGRYGNNTKQRRTLRKQFDKQVRAFLATLGEDVQSETTEDSRSTWISRLWEDMREIAEIDRNAED